MKPPILITGSHRSGKSYTVKGINLKSNFNIIHEPLNIDSRIGWTGLELEYYYTFIDETNSHNFKDEFSYTINNYRYRLFKQLKHVSNPYELISITKDIANSIKYRFNNNRTLIDDPFAIFSAEWFYREFNADIIIMIRHPASFAASLKLLNYHFPFIHLLDQRNLVEKKLRKYEHELKEFAAEDKNIVEQAVLLWRIIYDTASQFRNKYTDDWIFMRFEDIARNPKVNFEKIYKYLGLPVNQAELNNIRHTIWMQDSKPDKELNLLVNGDGYEYSVEDHLESYKKILNDSEINYVKEKAFDVWRQYYTDEDWE